MNVHFYVLLVVNCVLCSGSLFRTLGSSLFPTLKHRQTRSIANMMNQPFQLRRSNGRLSITLNSEQVIHMNSNGSIVSMHSAKTPNNSPLDQHSIGFEGIFGIYSLPAGSYLAIIKQAENMKFTTVPGVKKVRSVELIKIPTTRSTSHVSSQVNQTQIDESQKQAENLILSAFKQHTFYFSTSKYDLTRTYQSNMLSASASNVPTSTVAKQPSTDWSAVEEKYCWNLSALAPFLESNCSSMVTPVVNAHIGNANITHEGRQHFLTLISRRSRRRQGPR